MSTRLKAELAMALVCALWGTTFVVVKYALLDSSVFVYIAVRFGLAAVVMGLLFFRALWEMHGASLRSGVCIGVFMFGGYAFQNNGLILTSATKSALITGMTVVLVPMLLAVTGAGRINRWVWAGAVAALGGLYYLTVPPGAGLGGIRDLNRGDALTFIAAILFAFHVIFIGRATQKHPVVVLSAVQFATTAALSAVALPVFHAAGWEAPMLRVTTRLVLAVLLTGIAGTAMAFSVQVWSQRHIPPTHAGILLTLEPVFAALTSFIFAGERLGARAIAGAGLILAGILVAELKGPSPSPIES